MYNWFRYGNKCHRICVNTCSQYEFKSIQDIFSQYRAHQQLIHKRCPICRALFRAKSALESHLATKHPDEMAKGDINIDALPNAAIESPGPSSCNLLAPSPDYNKLLAPPAMQGLLPYMPQASLSGLTLPPMADPIQLSMNN